MLKLLPISSKLSDTNNIDFHLTDLPSDGDIRIRFENGTFNFACRAFSLENAVEDNGYVYPHEGSYEISGKLDLRMPLHAENSVVSIYANIEAFVGGHWRLIDIAAFAFQIESSRSVSVLDKVFIDPAFVGPNDRAKISVQTEPNSHLRVYINGKQFVIRSNSSGEGTMSFRGIDILSGSENSSEGLQRFPVAFSKPQDNHDYMYDSGIYANYMPENMKVLQAVNTLDEPECAILDPDPGPGLQVRQAEDFCFDGAVVGDVSIFDSDSDYFNSRVGFCGDLSEVSPSPVESDDICRIYNSTDTTLLPNGSALIAFSSATDPTAGSSDTSTDFNLASRVFLARTSTSLKYRGNPVRNGTILSPPQFSHSIVFNSLNENDVVGVVFIIDNGEVFEIERTFSGDLQSFINNFTIDINSDERIRDANINAIALSDRITFSSEARFTIKYDLDGSESSNIDIIIDDNKIIELFAPDGGFDDVGNTIVFLEPQLGAREYSIISRESPSILKFEVPQGVNNGIGPTVENNIFCQKFVVIDKDVEAPQDVGITEVNPLPYIRDKFQREVPSAFPSVTARKDYVGQNIYVYCVCQAIVDNVYQLFYYGFKLGSDTEESGSWIQITFDGENKNPNIETDSGGNLHLVWESDRMGASQIYYGILGPNSRAITNQVLMSAIDKEKESDFVGSLLDVNSPESIQSSWLRMLSGDGAGSVVSNSKIALQGRPDQDTAMSIYTLDSDGNGQSFNGLESDISYQISFDLSMGIITNQDDQIPITLRTDNDIDNLWRDWIGRFSAKQNFEYELDNNIFTLDRFDSFFERIIPICGSYKFVGYDSMTDAPGGTVPGFDHNFSFEFSDFNEQISTNHPGNLRHFMLALMPEKVRFKALNTEPLFEYLDKNNLTADDKDQYIPKIEETYYTGRFKLALVLATSEDESTGALSEKSFEIVRQFGDYITFEDLDSSTNIKIGINYSKQPLEAIENRTQFDRSAQDQDYRFYGNIFVLVDNEAQIGQSFIADLSDQYRKFDIALGMPSGSQFVTNEQIPYNGNDYDDLPVVQIFDNIAIGPHSVRINSEFADVSNFDRNTGSILLSDNFNDLITNGSFESVDAPIQPSLALSDGSQSIASWTVTNEVNVLRDDSGLDDAFSSYDGLYFVELTGTDNNNLGAISQTIDTEQGKEYVVEFAISPHPFVTRDLPASTIRRSLEVSAAGSTQNFDVLQFSNEVGQMKWRLVNFRFTASNSSTEISFTNVTNNNSPFDEYGPMIDRVRVYDVESLPDENKSRNVSEMLLLSEDEYNLNYSLNAVNKMTQLPVTLADLDQNRNADLSIDNLDKTHIAWQSNRNGPWEIYYASSRNRNLPFRFETRITDKNSNSLMPSVAVDQKGRRFISWHDNREGRYYQIYSAISKHIDPQWVDQCKIDMAEEHVYSTEDTNPYDPYNENVIGDLGCRVVFDFQTESSGLYHFSLDFYTDEEKSNLYKTVDSRDSVLGWRVNNTQLDYDGAIVSSGENVTVTYSPAQEDDLAGKLLFVTANFFSENTKNGDIVDGSLEGNIENIDPATGTDLTQGNYESDNVRIFSEGTFASTVSRQEMTANDLINTFKNVNDTDVVFDGDGTIAGFEEGDKIRSYYLHYDRQSSGDGNETVSVMFDSPIVAVYANRNDLDSVDTVLGRGDITYPDSGNDFGDKNDSITISEDRKTATIKFTTTSANVDDLRIVVAPVAEASGSSSFAYYCPFEQTPRCAITHEAINGTSADFNETHFRITFYADAEMESPVLSSFSMFDTDNWIVGGSEFPFSGIDIPAEETVNITYDPNVLPFELFDNQKESTVIDAIQSFFVNNNDGWRVFDGASEFEATWVSDGGSGAIFLDDNDSSDSAFFVAPSKFTGNLEDYYGGTIEASMRLDPQSNPSNEQTPTVKIDGFAGTLRYSAGSPPNRSDIYEKLSFRIDESIPGWEFEPASGGGFSTATEANMRAVLRDVTSVNMDADFFIGQDVIYMSDFAIRPKDENLSFDKPLLCGVPYYYKLEQFNANLFTELGQGMFICPCFYSDAKIWREDEDSKLWISSGQGFDDFKVSDTDNESINSHAVASNTGLFYVSWEDYRYTRLRSSQPALSPDYFFALYDAENDKLHSSAQGDFDRRVTFYSNSESGILYNSSIFLDQFQNFNIAFHNGSKVFHRSCSIGCALDTFNPNITQPCMFTDGTGNDFYQVGGEPARDIEQYQKIRIREPYVAYSTHLDLETPIPVVHDCFIELDIVGVPGTYAYRLRNEDDDEWTEWLPIGPSLPEQPSDDDDTQSERDFFSAFFIAKDRFIAPWISSPGNGAKKVLCEVLTFFGKTTTFSVNFEAVYRKIDYKIDFFFDQDFEQPVPEYNSYPVASTQRTLTPIEKDNLISITEETQSVSTIYVRVTFPDIDRIQLLEMLSELDRYSGTGFTMSVFQQGINDKIGLPLTKVSEGVYRGSFEVEESDSVVNVDGLGLVTVSVPGQCSSALSPDSNPNRNGLFDSSFPRASVKIFNDMTLFRDQYMQDDIRNSFGNPDYYKQTQFGSPDVDQNAGGGDSDWIGGGEGPVGSD